MTNDNEQLRKIQEIDIESYVTDLGDYSLIKPLEIDYRRVVNRNKYLRDYTLEINLVCDGLYQWRKFLLNAQAKLKENKTITPESFEAAYIWVCRNGLLDWVEFHFDLPTLYPYLTGQALPEKRLLVLAKEYTRGGF